VNIPVDRLAILLVAFAAAIAVPRTHAQGCCTAGASTLGGVESGVLKHHHLSIGLNYQFNSLTRTHQERKRIDDPLQRVASVSYFTLQMEYGLVPRVSLFVALPFADKSREITVTNALTGFSETATFGSSGIGDMTILVKHQVISPTITSPFELAAGIGAGLPTGSFTKEQNNARLAIDLQPGTGATALVAWWYVMRSFPAQGIRLLASGTYRYPGTNFDGYRIGNEWVMGIGVEYTLSENFAGSLLVRSRFASQDYANRRILSATGGTYHDLMPAISYADGPAHVRAFGQLPLYRNVRGIQLTVAYLLGVEFSYTFDLSGEEEPSPE
jgi:hypothetical protein